MTEWKQCIIADLGDVVTGKTPPTKNTEFWDGEVHFVTPKDIQGLKHITDTERRITDEGLQKVKGSALPQKAVCVSCIGNIGYTGMTTQMCVSNQQINSIIVNSDNDPDYVYYLMRSLWPFFKNYEGQSTTLSILNKTQFSKIAVTVPDKATQKRIAAALSALDDKIAANAQINDNLLQQAQALYGKFFPYDIADELPAGWRVGTVGEIVEIHDSKRIPLSGAQRAKMEKRIYPYYGAASLMDYVDEYIFDGIYLLLGEDGTVVDDAGYPILQYVWGQFWVNNHAHILTGKLGFNVESLLLLFKHTPVKSIVTGAVQPKISQANLRSVQVVIPPQPELDAFNELIRPMFDQIRQNQDQNKALAAMRDALLPKLMSGEVDVSAIQI